MNVCMGVFLIVTGSSILQPTDPVEDFQRVVDGVNWSDPTERDHQAALQAMRQLARMGQAGQWQLQRVVAPALSEALLDHADGTQWADETERDHVAVRYLTRYLRDLSPASDSVIADAVAPDLANRFEKLARGARWADSTERDLVGVRNLLARLLELGFAAEPTIEKSVAPRLGEYFAYHTVRRNADWTNPRDQDQAAARNLARLLYGLGRPAYGVLEDPVLRVLGGETAAAAQALADEISRVSLQAEVLAVDFERREVLLRDRRGARYRLRVAERADVPPGALQVGRTVVVTLDLRTQLVLRVERARL